MTRDQVQVVQKMLDEQKESILRIVKDFDDQIVLNIKNQITKMVVDGELHRTSPETDKRLKALEDILLTSDERWKRIEPIVIKAEQDALFKKAAEDRAGKITKWGSMWLIVVAVIASIITIFKQIKW